MQTYKISTLNINRISSHVKILSLAQYLRAADVDIVLLQEALSPQIADITGYEAIVNIGTEAGTMILYKQGIPCSPLAILPTGRGIAAKFHDILLLNVYAPSGSNARAARKAFFSGGIAHLITDMRLRIVMGGDFNCVVRQLDQTPNFNFSQELLTLTTELQLVDTWIHLHPTGVAYTHVTSTSASRIDRVYVQRSLLDNVLSCEYWPVHFTDHTAYHVLLNHIPQEVYRGPGRWHLNCRLLQDDILEQEIRSVWQTAVSHRPKYTTSLAWWTLYAKGKLVNCLKRYAKTRARWENDTKEFYFCALRELYEDHNQLTNNITQIRRIQAKLTSLTSKSAVGHQIRSRDFTNLPHQKTSVFHLVRELHRARRKLIEKLQDDDGNSYTHQQDIKTYVTTHFAALYASAGVPAEKVTEWYHMAPPGHKISDGQNQDLLTPFTTEELGDVLRAAPRNKSPGMDGLPVEFYTKYWHIIGDRITEICNEILRGTGIPPAFTEGITVLIPKKPTTKTIKDFRPITLLNADFKLLTRAINVRLRPLLPSLLGPYQMSAVRGRTMSNILALYRDLVTLTWTANAPMAIAFLDFDKAYDRVEYHYLSKVMELMGFSHTFVNVVNNCIRGTRTKFVVNGTLTGYVSLSRGIKQGCPLSTTLYAIFIEPLLRKLHLTLPGFQFYGIKSVVQAYADDVSVLLNNDQDMDEARLILENYQRDSGAHLSVNKSAILTIGQGTPIRGDPWLPCVLTRKQLGMYVTARPQDLYIKNWQPKIQAIKATLRDQNMRNLDRLQRAFFVNSYALSKLQHIAAVLPMPTTVAQQLLAAAGWYVWKLNIFKVPFKTTAMPCDMGGLGLLNPGIHALAIYLKRSWKILTAAEDTVTKRLYQISCPHNMSPPVDIANIGPHLKHISLYYLESSYIQDGYFTKTTAYLYRRLLRVSSSQHLENKYPACNWKRIWANIHNTILPTDVRSKWYDVVTETVPTQEKRHRINLAQTPLCASCHEIATVAHIFTCRDQVHIWNWTRKKLAVLNRTAPHTITITSLLRPDFRLFTDAKHNSYIWLAGHFIYYMLATTSPALLDFQAYLLHQHWRTKNQYGLKYRDKFQNFLTVTLSTP